MIFKTNLKSGSADASDLRNDSLLQWQHQWYFYLAALWGLIIPTIVPGLLWNDWAGGFCFSFALRLTVAHHVGLFDFFFFGRA
jgi:stearoyl-CoA desaturase (Delta-9 desaturase)